MTARVLVAVLVAALSVTGCRQAPIYDVNEVKFVEQRPSLDEVQAAVVRAGESLDWRMVPVAPGHVVADLAFKNKHFVTTDVMFDTVGFSIHYKSTQNLNYDGQYVHPAYNKWVKQLEDAIQREVQRL